MAPAAKAAQSDAVVVGQWIEEWDFAHKLKGEEAMLLPRLLRSKCNASFVSVALCRSRCIATQDYPQHHCSVKS